MKWLVVLMVLAGSYLGCSDKSMLNPEADNEGLQGNYSGNFTLVQGEALSEGYMEMKFEKNHYRQLIVFTSYNSDSVESYGTYDFFINYVEFNKNLEDALMLFPAWFLLGSCSAEKNDGQLKLRFQDGYRDYNISLIRQ